MSFQLREFLSKRCCVDDYQRSVDAYSTVLRSALSLDESLVISLDTNVLLNELNLERDIESRFTQFLKSNSRRIVVPSQVKEEYGRYSERTPDCFDISGMPVLPPLSEQERARIIEEYEWLRTLEPAKAFPGSGDIKGKPEYPYGDYLIFHELLRHMKSEERHLVFLTNDIFKGDWLTTDCFPHGHLIEATYLATGHSLVILPAARFIKQLFSDNTPPKSRDYFNPTCIYKDRFNSMWDDVQLRIKVVGRSLTGSETRFLGELRKVKKILTLSDDITHNSYIDESWLYRMEQLSEDLGQVDCTRTP